MKKKKIRTIVQEEISKQPKNINIFIGHLTESIQVSSNHGMNSAELKDKIRRMINDSLDDDLNMVIKI